MWAIAYKTNDLLLYAILYGWPNQLHLQSHTKWIKQWALACNKVGYFESFWGRGVRSEGKLKNLAIYGKEGGIERLPPFYEHESTFWGKIQWWILRNTSEFLAWSNSYKDAKSKWKQQSQTTIFYWFSFPFVLSLSTFKGLYCVEIWFEIMVFLQKFQCWGLFQKDKASRDGRLQ